MPSVSRKQHNLMAMMAFNPPKKGKRVSKKVAKEFIEADKKAGKYRKKK